MVDGLVKLVYPDGEFTKEQLEEILKLALEMRRRVKEQLKKLGGMEFYDVNFSYIDKDSFEETYVSVLEQGGGKLIPEGMCSPGQVYTVSQGKSGMIGVFRLESQMLPGNGKFERTGLGSDREVEGSHEHRFQFPQSQRRTHQRDDQHHDEGLYRQLSGFAGNRHDCKARPSHLDCAGLHCTE